MQKPMAPSSWRPSKSAIKFAQTSLSNIHGYAHNPREHSAPQIAAIARSIAASGFINPLILDRSGQIIAGHARFEAAKLVGLEAVPTITVSHLSEAQKRAYRIADNRLAEVGSTWSYEKLEIEVSAVLEMDTDFDIELTGFEARDLELKFDAAEVDVANDQDAIPAPTAQAVTRIGDLWRIGDHSLLCGDATERASYAALMDRERAAMVFADSPYNVPMAGHATGNGGARHREFIQASGELSDSEFQQFLLAFMMLAARYSRSGALHFICMDWRHLRHLLLAGGAAYDEYVNLCVWAKTNASLGSLYRSQHELVAIFKKGRAAHVNNVELGKNGRHRSNLWTYSGMNIFSAERTEALALHPTVKPLALEPALLEPQDAVLTADFLSRQEKK